MKTTTVLRPQRRLRLLSAALVSAALSACAYTPVEECSPRYEDCGPAHSTYPHYPDATYYPHNPNYPYYPSAGYPVHPGKNPNPHAQRPPPPPHAHRPPPHAHPELRPPQRPPAPYVRPHPTMPPQYDTRPNRPPPAQPRPPQPPRHDARPEQPRPAPPPHAPQAPSQYQNPDLSREQIESLKRAIGRLPQPSPSQEVWRPNAPGLRSTR